MAGVAMPAMAATGNSVGAVSDSSRSAEAAPGGDTIGLATGGAQDVENFRWGSGAGWDA